MNDVKYCEYLTGLPPKFYDFIASFETNGGSVEFYSSSPVEVNWGTGKWVYYDEGVVHGFQDPASVFSNSPVEIRSTHNVEKFRFGSGVDFDRSYIRVDIHKAFGLRDAEKLCYRLEEMKAFSFFGTNKVETFESAWEDCTELLNFEGMDTTRALTFRKAWKNCNKLRNFPSVYSRGCSTVEAAWLGCTSMEEFPVIGVENCINFKDAWRGNVNLVYFPFIDVSMGENFDHSWAYCTRLGDFPSLNFENAKNMNNSVSYNHRIRAYPFFNTGLARTFRNMFRKCLSLECISGIDTKSINNTHDTENMFMLTPKLERPDVGEQYYIENGTSNSPWENNEPCYFDAGRSVFFVRTATDGTLCEFEVVGGDIEVDWGDGLWLHYNEGVVTGMPITTNGVNIRSEENITNLHFTSDNWRSIQIKRGRTLETFESMCEDKKMLENFEVLGHLIATNFDRMLKNCHALKMVEYVNFSYAETMVETFMNCRSLLGFEIEEDLNIVDMAKCKDFTRCFYDCESLDHLPILLTDSGESFVEMFQECKKLKCLYGIDTRAIASPAYTVGMFDDIASLIRPNRNELPRILNGMFYRNGDTCSTEFDMRFQDNGNNVEFTTDSDIKVDWGNGVYLDYGPGQITGKAITAHGNIYVSGKVTDISFDNDNFTEIEFMNADGVSNFYRMFENKHNLKVFRFSCIPQTDSLKEMFFNCYGLEEFYSHDVGGVEDFEGMFDGASNLVHADEFLSQDGKYFERMFNNCGALSCVGGINTMNGIFPPNYIICDLHVSDCTDVLDCNVDMDCKSAEIGCIPGQDLVDCYMPSTMFDGCSALTSPDALEQKDITSRDIFKSTMCE